MLSADQAWSELTAHMREVSLLQSAGGVLVWDQQTHLPRGAATQRGQQVALISRLAHEGFTSSKVGDLLGTLADAQLPARHAAAVSNLRREYARATRVSADLVRRLEEAHAAGFQAWLTAKQASNFAQLVPALSRVIDLKLELADAIGPGRPAYDVLLEEYEPDGSVATLRPMFSRLQAGLVELVDSVRGHTHPPDLDAAFPVEGQHALHLEVLKALGFDDHRGRLDVSEHPFTTGLGDGDTRITTHLYETNLLAGLGGTIHEAGHGMYEQGLPKDFPGTTLDQASSIGMHESQSRFWENFIGRSLPFFQWISPKIEAHCGRAVDPQTLYRAANRIQPSLIRIFADEVTYNLHIIVRFELELALVEGTLAVADLPEAWNAGYRKALGVVPDSEDKGVLQDVHWASGAFAYFPTYTLGNLSAASLSVAIERDLPDLWSDVGRGEFAPTLGWLRDKVHRHGMGLNASQIVEAAAGKRDSVDDLLSHLWNRHGALYGVTRP